MLYVFLCLHREFVWTTSLSRLNWCSLNAHLFFPPPSFSCKISQLISLHTYQYIINPPISHLSCNFPSFSSFTLLPLFSCHAGLYFWCATKRPVNDLQWRRSTGRTWSLGTKSSRCLWSETSSPLLKTHLWFLCSALLRHGDTYAWSWSMLKVKLFAIVHAYILRLYVFIKGLFVRNMAQNT